MTGDDSDDGLWRRCGDGDGAAMERLFRRHADRIYGHVFRLTASWSRSEEIVSIVFLEAWRKRETSLSTGAVLPWLYGIAGNVLRNEIRARGRHRRLIEKLSVCAFDRDFVEGLASRIDDEARAGELLALIQQFPQHEQDVIALCWWSGLTLRDAALALELPVGTVKSRLSRARQRLLAHTSNSPSTSNESGDA